MNSVVIFFAGLMIGASTGMVVMAMLVAAHKGDE